MNSSNPHHTARTSGWQTWFALAIVTVLLGCATEVATHTFIGQARAAKPADHPIDIYTNGVPTKPYERVAILDVHCESQGWMEPNLENDAIPMLIREARAAGCDGVMEIERRKSDNWTFETKVQHFTATGIAYK